MEFKNRLFSLIDFSSSHNQFLFRAMKDNNFKKNMDILFEGVSYIQLPLFLKNIEITIGKKEELKDMFFEKGSTKSERLYVLQCNSSRYYIIASKASYLENTFVGHESSMPIKLEKPLTQEDIFNLVAEAEEKGAEFLMQEYNKTDWIEIK